MKRSAWAARAAARSPRRVASGLAVGDVGADGVGEEEAVLGDQPDGGPQRVEGQLAHVVAADEDGAVGDVVEARQQQRDGGLAAARRSRRRRRSRRGGSRSEKPSRTGRALAPRSAKATSSNSTVAGASAGSSLVPSLHGRLGVDQLQDALDAGPGLLADGEHHGEHPDRADELGEIGGEGDERAEGDLPAGGQPAAERQHRDLAERGYGLQGRGVPGVQPDGAQPAGEQPAADLPAASRSPGPPGRSP